MTPPPSSTPPPAAIPAPSTTSPSRRWSLPSPPAKPSSTSRPPAPPSPNTPTPDTGTSPTTSGTPTTKAPQPPRLRGLQSPPHRPRQCRLHRHLQCRATAAPGVGRGDAVADQPLVQRQIRELALLDARAGEELIRWLAGRVATCDGRRCGTRTGHRAIGAVRLSRRGTGGCCRARSGGGAGLPPGLGVGHRVAALGGDAGEVLQVLAG